MFVLVHKRLSFKNLLKALEIAFTKELGVKTVDEFCLIGDGNFDKFMTFCFQKLDCFLNCSPDSWRRFYQVKTLKITYFKFFLSRVFFVLLNIKRNKFLIDVMFSQIKLLMSHVLHPKG